MLLRTLMLLCLLLSCGINAWATNDDAPVVEPTVLTSKVLYKGDSIPYMEMGNVYVYPERKFKSKKQERAYLRLVRNVKKTLPIAKEARAMMIETYEFLETLPNEKARREHLKRVEKDVMNTYKPRMKKLTYAQGKLLIKLVHRECNSSSYEIVKAFLGPLRAGFYQTFAAIFGASLRKKWDPEGDDKMAEQVILMVEAGQL